LAQQEKNLAAMQQRIVSLNRDYKWKPYTGKVTLIRSAEFNSDPLKNYHIPHWQELAAGGVDVHVVESTHDTLFEEPDVQNLAHQLTTCLNLTYQLA
jgi:thioesterase domain-containing protein